MTTCAIWLGADGEGGYPAVDFGIGDPRHYGFVGAFVAPESVTLEMAINEIEFWFHWLDRVAGREARGIFEDPALLREGDPRGRVVAWADDTEPQPARDFGVTDGISAGRENT